MELRSSPITLQQSGLKLTVPSNAAPAPNASLDLVLYFIPGNPGIISYYPLFLHACQDELLSAGLSAHVVALGHLEHRCPPSNASSKGKGKSKETREESYPPVGLQTQQEHHSLFTSSLAARFPGTPIVIIGHSLGGYIGMHLLPSHPEISSAIFVFPALSHLAQSPNGKRLDSLLRTHLITTPTIAGTWLASLLPSFLLVGFVRRLLGHSEDSAKATAALISSPTNARNMLFLLADALAEIADLPFELLQEHANKLDLYYTAVGMDGRVAEHTLPEIEQALQEGARNRKGRTSGTIARCEEGMVHAFTIKDDYALSLARKVAGWIKGRR